jgi:hypothetical protein
MRARGKVHKQRKKLIKLKSAGGELSALLSSFPKTREKQGHELNSKGSKIELNTAVSLFAISEMRPKKGPRIGLNTAIARLFFRKSMGRFQSKVEET